MDKSILKNFVSSPKKNTLQQSNQKHTTTHGLSAEDKGKILGIVSMFLVGSATLYFIIILSGQLFALLLSVLSIVVILAVPVYFFKSPKQAITIALVLLLCMIAVSYYNSTL